MAQAQQKDTRFQEIPEEVHRMIISNMPPMDRLRTAGLDDYWRRTATTTSKYSKVAIVAKNPYTDISLAGFKILFEDHAMFQLESWAQIVDCIRFCGEGADIISLKIACCEFDDAGDWTNIGEYLSNLQSLTIIECLISAAEITEIVSTTISLIEFSLLTESVTIPDVPEVVRNILNRNRSLRHLTIRDFDSRYENIVIRSSLETIHLSVPNGFDDYFWYSLKAHSRLTLRKFCCEFFERSQQTFLRFDNLTDLRVANVRFRLNPEVFGRLTFPNLHAFTIHQREIQPGTLIQADYSDHLYRHSQGLRVFNAAAFFRQEVWIQLLSTVYIQLRYLVLNLMLTPNVITINAIRSLTQLRYLVVHDTRNNRIEDHLLNLMITELQNLRVLIYRSCHQFDHPFEITFNSICQLALGHPNQLYFVSLPGIVVFQQHNVLNALDDRYRDILLFWDNPFELLYSYSTWERITEAFLEGLGNF